MGTTTVFIPVTNGRANSTQTPTPGAAFDTNLTKYTCSFSAAADERLHFFFYLPPNWQSGAFSLSLLWRTTATANDCMWTLFWVRFLSGTAAQAAFTQAMTDTAAGTTLFINDATTAGVGPSGANESFFPITVKRDGAGGGDTLASSAELLGIKISYTSDPTILKGYLWVPSNAFTIPSSSSMTLGTPTSTTQFMSNAGESNPYCLLVPDSGTPIADYRFNVPNNYSGSMKITLVWMAKTGGGTTQFRYDAAVSAVGASKDPALTAGGSFAISGSATGCHHDLQRAFTTVTPVAGSDLIIRLVREPGDGSTVQCEVMGMMIEWAVNGSYPVPLRLDPNMGNGPAAATATLTQVHDTNSSKGAVRYTDGVDQAFDFQSALPAQYQAGGTIRVRWTSPAAAGNARFRIDVASPATNTASDPALVAGTAYQNATAGANLVNETTLDIGSGFAASDILAIKINRLASDSLDTLSDVVDIIDVCLDSYSTL